MESLMVSIKENWCQKWSPHNIHKSSGKQVLRAQTYQVEYNNIIYKFLERHILKALWRFTILKINKKLQKTIKSLSKKKGLEAPFECV